MAVSMLCCHAYGVFVTGLLLYMSRCCSRCNLETPSSYTPALTCLKGIGCLVL
jgi:hypothetical protein